MLAENLEYDGGGVKYRERKLARGKTSITVLGTRGSGIKSEC